jgi:hypothetical protein
MKKGYDADGHFKPKHAMHLIRLLTTASMG